MIALGTKLFIFGGTSRKGTPGVAQCDIYDFEQSMWKEGPRLPVAFRGGSSVLVRERYAVVFGGIGQGEKQLKQSWVLDLKPWLEAGSDTAEAPASSWFRGPDLPMELGDPMICYVSDAASGRPESWILAAGPSLLGNFCVGLKITADADLTQAKFWRSLRWLSMGATPDSYILTGCVASKGSLMIVGGYSCSENTATDKVWFREFSQQPGLLLPAAPSSGGDLKEKSELLELQRMVLNDHFPIGRLGLPLSEEQLFSSDAVKKLTLLPPGLCDMCLDSGRSVEASRTDTARFCIQKDKMSRRFSMCSRCFCAATEVSTQETTETVNVLEHAMSTPNEEEKDAGNTSIVGEGGEEKKEESTEEEKLTEDLKAVLLEDFHRSLEEEGIVVDGKNVETLFDGVFGEEKGEKNNRRESTRNEPGQVFRNIVWRGQQGKLRLTSDGFSFKPKGSACYSWQWSSVQKCLMAAKQSNQTQLKLSCKHSTRKSVIFSLRTREDLEALHKVAKNYMREAQSKGGTMHADESERTASTTDTTGRDVSESWL
ncbi:expressed unknown protein [Seminavis robusta]|uniref:Uncharacterized protein n=1 Tax=Seminavis robusta TaxID=568900 RepID=A0A9N8DYE1_9STRA|nr:expressed unknown protein [Seminavis robusta]|eukprot:Sro473_g150100.1 n/a (542) ;mRNA; r:30631-32380